MISRNSKYEDHIIVKPKRIKKNIITSPAQQFHQLFPTTFVQYFIAWII
jgi:hypothetical protein